MRYIAARDQQNNWAILDMLQDPPRIIASCSGHYKTDNMELICTSLNNYSGPVDKLIDDVKAKVIKK